MYFDEMIWAAVQAFSGDLQPTLGSQVSGSTFNDQPVSQMDVVKPTVSKGPVVTMPPARWMKAYDNGHIPLKAMVQIPGGGYLRPDAASAFIAMYKAAKADGVDLAVGSSGAAYRSYQQQYSAYYNPQNNLPHAVPGTSNHGWGLAVDMTANEWLLNHADEYGWYRPLENDPPHWEYNGAYGGAGPPRPERQVSTRSMQAGGRFSPNPMFAIEGLTSDDDPNYFANGIFAVLADEGARKHGKLPIYVTKGDEGPGGATKRQLWQGFMDAGRPDLAKMVYTKDFDTWIKAESGWNPSVVSQYYEGHGRNAGLFQFALLDRNWVWRDVNEQSWTYGATAYEQAQMVVKYFDLTPAEIRNYAQQVRNGTYSGWG